MSKHVYIVLDVWHADIEGGATVCGAYKYRVDAEKAVQERKKEVIDDMCLKYDHEEWANGEFYGYNDDNNDFTELRIDYQEIKEKENGKDN